MIKLKGLFLEVGTLGKILLLLGVTLMLSLFAVAAWQLFTSANPNDISSLKILQLFQSVATFVLAPLFLSYLFSKNHRKYLHLDSKTDLNIYVLVAIFMVIIIPFVNLLGYLNQQIVLPELLKPIEIWMKNSELQAAELTERLLDVRNVQGLLFNVFLIAILPAIGEELYFRGIVQKVLSNEKHVIFGIWSAAFIFSAIHLQFYGFFPRLLLGAFFGYLLYWSGNLWLPILAHFINNVMAVLFYYFQKNGYQLPDIDKVGTESSLWLGCLSGVVAIGGIYFIRKLLVSRN